MRLLLRQVAYEHLAIARNPAAVLLGLLLPVMFLVVLATTLGRETIDLPAGLDTPDYYVPAILSLGIVSVTFMNLAISMTTMRERGFLKRLRGTPLPMWLLILGRVGTAMSLALVLTVLLTAVGTVAYGLPVPSGTLPALLATVAVAAASFCCLGIAVSAAFPNEELAAGATNAFILPLYLVSGVFFPMEGAPGWVRGVADFFPVSHLTDALLSAYDPAAHGAAFEPGHLAVIAVWGVAAGLVASRSFRWAPRVEGR